MLPEAGSQRKASPVFPGTEPARASVGQPLEGRAEQRSMVLTGL